MKIFNAKFSDLGPFRVIKYNQITSFKQEDKTMDLDGTHNKVLKQKNGSYKEIPVRYKK
jgi:hypothetical protein